MNASARVTVAAVVLGLVWVGGQAAGAGEQEERQTVRTEALARIKEAQEEVKRIPPGPEGDQGRIGVAITMAVSWREAGNAEEAAKWLWAEGDRGGAYALARVHRLMAGVELADAAPKGQGTGDITVELGLADAADIPMALLTAQWDVKGKQATATKSRMTNSPFNVWMPAMRQVDGVWRIDVSEEVRGKAAAEAERAEAEAKALKDLTARVRGGEFKSAAEVVKAAQKAGVKGIMGLRKEGTEE